MLYTSSTTAAPEKYGHSHFVLINLDIYWLYGDISTCCTDKLRKVTTYFTDCTKKNRQVLTNTVPFVFIKTDQ